MQISKGKREFKIDRDRTREKAIESLRRYRYGIYDSLIIAAAIEVACDTLYSEDMQSDQTIHGLKIRNPFSDLQTHAI